MRAQLKRGLALIDGWSPVVSLLSSGSVDADDVAVHKAGVGVGSGGQKREGFGRTRGCGREFMMSGI